MNRFTPEADFRVILDNTQTIRLSRPGSGLDVCIQNAVRGRTRTTAASDDGDHHRHACQWVFPDIRACPLTGNVSPMPGDILRTEDGRQWTIRRVTRRGMIGCWQCEAERLLSATWLDGWADYFRAVWKADVNGVPVPTYVLTLSGMSVGIHEAMTKSSETFKQTRAEIFFTETIHPNPGDRFVTADGRAFRVLEFHPRKESAQLSRCVVEQS